jgi:hypothetical protein
VSHITRTILIRCGLVLMPLGFVIPVIAIVRREPIGSEWFTYYSGAITCVLANLLILIASRKMSMRILALLAIASIAAAIYSVNVPGVSHTEMQGPGYFYAMLFVCILLPLSVLLLLMVFVGGILEARRNPSLEGHCTHCGYNLKGLTEHRCPECGTAFDPTAEPDAASVPESRGRA